MNPKNLEQAWRRLLAGGSFVLACHEHPDGDTLGSALALAHVLKASGKDVVVLAEDGVPEHLSFIPESDSVVESTDRRDFDVGLLIDSEGIGRVGGAADIIKCAGITGCIDHHIPDGEFGEVRIVDTGASATAELLAELFEANGVALDQTTATQLMTGLISDTGALRFANTTPRTFRVAARLTELGAHPSSIARNVYETRSVVSMKLLGRALESLQIEISGRVAWASITRRDLEDLGGSDADTDSIVNVVGWVKGPAVCILFREIEPESIRISLRSRDSFDVNRIARAFGGGGHAAAAGCTVDAALERAREMVVGEVVKWMES